MMAAFSALCLGSAFLIERFNRGRIYRRVALDGGEVLNVRLVLWAAFGWNHDVTFRASDGRFYRARCRQAFGWFRLDKVTPIESPTNFLPTTNPGQPTFRRAFR